MLAGGDNDGTLQKAEESTIVDNLKHKSFPHGTFFFGRHGHQRNIPNDELIDPTSSWTALQRTLLDDADINIEEEKKRID